MEANEKNLRQRRQRRTKVAVEQDIFDAAVKIITNTNFSSLTVIGIVKEAKIEPHVFYSRYKDIDDFVDKFVREYDYWINDSISYDEKLDPVENAQNIMEQIVDSLLDNAVMQKLLAWEMSENNYTTRRSGQYRDSNSESLIDFYSNVFAKCEVNFNFSVATLIGGIYYLIIHRKMGTFNKINFDSQVSIDGLKKNIRIMVRKIFDDFYEKADKKSIKSTQIDIAKRLIESNVSYDIIKKSTLLRDDTLKALYEEYSNEC